jgi:RNA polymerase sigma factor (sigma-70 family)
VKERDIERGRLTGGETVGGQRMSDANREALRRSLVLSYEDLKSRLTRYLGSAELASDALQETYVRLHGGAELAPVRWPTAYLMRMAIRIALRNLRGAKKTVSLEDAKAAFGIADDAPGPHRHLEARGDLDAFRNAVRELTPRRRAILYAARVEGLTLQMIAARLGISQRLVEIELKHALAHCAQRLDREIEQRFGPRSVQASDNHEHPRSETDARRLGEK